MATGSRGWRRLVLNTGSSEKTALEVRAAGSASPLAADDPQVMRIGEGLQFEGSLATQKSVEIHGEFRGSIQSEATVFIGENAGVQADIRARVVVIRGALVGNVVATRELLLHANGRLTGDVEALTFTIEKGALFNGRSVMIPPHLKLRDPLVAAPAAPSDPAPPSA